MRWWFERFRRRASTDFSGCPAPGLLGLFHLDPTKPSVFVVLPRSRLSKKCECGPVGRDVSRGMTKASGLAAASL